VKLLTTIATAVLALAISTPVRAVDMPQVPSPIVNLPAKVKSVNLLSDWVIRGGTTKSRCMLSATVSASAIYYRERYESQTIMSYAGHLRNEICEIEDEAYFALVEDEFRRLSSSGRSMQVFLAEQLMEHYKANGIAVEKK
jgi:hypothetical protein